MGRVALKPTITATLHLALKYMPKTVRFLVVVPFCLPA